MLDFLKRLKPLKSGTRALYKRTGEVVEVIEHKLPNQVTIKIDHNTKAFNSDFRYIAFLNRDHESLTKPYIEVTISIDMLEVLPDGIIAKLLY